SLSCRELARRFRISVSSAVRWLQRQRRTGESMALPMGGDRRSVLKPKRDWLLALIAREPDLTLMRISERLRQEHDVRADASMLCRFFQAEGLSFKKKRVHAAEQLRPEIAALRQGWRQSQPQLAAHRLIFIDETGAATNMVRLYGRGPRGSRVKGYAPAGHWETTTFVAGLTATGLIAPLVVNGPMTRLIFTEYVRQFLARELLPGDIVIMDNLPSHKNDDVAAAIAERGARLLFLPPYSPDLNPIEQAFAKLKNALRTAAERTRESLWQRIGHIIDQFTPSECANYIRHAGYASA
ncbi:MAG: IS630 family transposase, partial [Burkholderiales bacterium]